MKINLKNLQESINKDANLIYEGLNTIEAKKLYSLAVDLYEEINCFEKEAPYAAVNALAPHLNKVHEMLESMLREPLNYVSKLEDEATKELGLSDEESEEDELGLSDEESDEESEEDELDLSDEESEEDELDLSDEDSEEDELDLSDEDSEEDEL